MKHPILSCLVALSATALLALVPVRQGRAADAAPKKPATASPPAAPAAKSKANVMTREELRVCLDEKDKLQQLRTQVLKEDAALTAQRGEIQKLDADQAQRRAALDPADTAGAEALLAEIGKRDQLAGDYNTRSRALNEQSKALDDRRTAWLARCDRPYDEYDEAVILKERKRAAGAAK